MELEFEPMVASDLPAVLEIERLSFPKPWTSGLFLHELQLEFARQLVARRGGEVVGYACWWVVAGEVHILNVAVHPGRRVAGVGKRIVGQILRDGVAAEAEVVGLEVRGDNEAAIALYSACGFARVGERRDYYGPGLHAVLMDCPLPGKRGASGEPPRKRHPSLKKED